MMDVKKLEAAGWEERCGPGTARVALGHAAQSATFPHTTQARPATHALRHLTHAFDPYALPRPPARLQAAADALRAKGLAKAAKKAGRTAMEGLVGVALSDDAGAAALVEINSETDFVARNERFQILVGRVAAAALAEGTAGDVPARRSAATGSMELDVEALLGRPDGTDGDLKMTVTEVAAACGENVRVRRASLVLAPPGGHVAVYMHNSPAGATALGQMGGAVAVAPGANADEAARIAMHAVAARPAYLNRASVPPEDLERERAVLSEQALASGKPANVVEKMVAGRLNKFYEEHALAEQKLVMDDKIRQEGARCRRCALQLCAPQVGEGMSAPTRRWKRPDRDACARRPAFAPAPKPFANY